MADADMREVFSASGDLVAAVRGLVVVASVSDVDAPTMQQATKLVDRASKMLAARVRTTGRREHLDRGAIARLRGGEPWEVFTHNPMGIPLRISVSGAEATATVVTTALFEGPPGILHGGFVAATLDALLSALVQVQEIRAVTVELDVRFLRAVEIGTELHLRGTVNAVGGRKARAAGWVHSDDDLVAEAEGLFITIPGDPD
ncbi:PaaI family thioesterase [Mycobacterium sp.]|uniref:PaaI family thioesterase n=1 Tax=Mycobacterium sp. TaxID=1785 RepID=UPI003F95ECC6